MLCKECEELENGDSDCGGLVSKTTSPNTQNNAAQVFNEKETSQRVARWLNTFARWPLSMLMLTKVLHYFATRYSPWPPKQDRHGISIGKLYLELFP